MSEVGAKGWAGPCYVRSLPLQHSGPKALCRAGEVSTSKGSKIAVCES